ncbi:ribose ABC transporter substrate-binding protein RbsB [Paenactinomyces guangxiensis]|uniref:Ribose ABC transporter substrate-binding protein RbsB n=1 Tax=Paenactinomyces guangxiensis TaxID=1490290 RepID=A0A7W1WT34_9BACL|nr:ribose ABC transporter substrate-binding protein RbsB [Paenactinomyces guangxiensis]MBA4495494.1 ribose ABC transporter substrate-binding protein RbsB [Paenactinomyces guangxiensis]MBH8592383.1 ribose ABC transporter substrate-binding protein RbsB [Paenactinomyces guangxiensis]
MRKYLSLLLVLLLGISVLTACSTESGLEAESKKADKSVKIGFSISTLNNPFFVSLKEGAEKVAKQEGIELIVTDAQDDTAKQVSDVEDLIQKNVDIILINPTDGKAVVTAVESANKAKIPVITVDREAEGGEVLSHIASDNVSGGKMAGEFILNQIGNKGKLVELQGIPGTSAARDRGKGFHLAVDGEDGVEVVASQPADFARDKGLTVMENILQSQPDIQAVFAHNDEMALGALKAIQEAKKQILVVGFDATDDAMAAVKKGELGATIAQKPGKMGEIAVSTAIQAAQGNKVEKFHPVELELIKKQ